MLVNWAYVPRSTVIHRLDPRARIIFMLCCLIALGFVPFGPGVGIWDLRLILVLFVIAVLQIFLARLSWRQTRRFWIIISIFAVVFSLVTLVTGRGALEVYDPASERPLWTFAVGPLQLNISAERLMFMIAQVFRIVTFAAISIIIPYTIDPALYGIAFRKLGLGDKIAYAMELAFRFIPTLGRDLQITMDAQRARGFEMEGGKGQNVIQRVRNFAPLLIPVTVGAVVEGEEITDAMDLRAFGVGPRTWLPVLRYSLPDYLYIGVGLFILAGTIVLKQAGGGGLWIPESLIR
jgi:energy-coupling factor transport system permease protein